MHQGNNSGSVTALNGFTKIRVRASTIAEETDPVLMRDIRISAIERYAAAFTPPDFDTALTTDANTIALYSCATQDADNLVDSSGNDLTLAASYTINYDLWRMT